MRFDIPEIGKLYLADDNAWLGNTFEIDGRLYKFVYFPVGTGIRKYDICYIDGENYAFQVQNIKWITNSIATYDIDAIGTACYGLLQIGGDTNALLGGDASVNNVNNAPFCVYQRTKLVPWVNGATRCVNAVINVSPSTAMTIAVSYCTQIHTFTVDPDAEGTIASHNEQKIDEVITTGSICNTNLGNYTFISKVNATNMSIVGVSNAVIGSALCIVVETKYEKGHNMYATSANAIQKTTTFQSHPQINACNKAFYVDHARSSTIIFTNAAICGRFLKQNDRVTLANNSVYSTLRITGLVNAYAATINAKVNVALNSVIGSDMNVNCYVTKAYITR